MEVQNLTYILNIGLFLILILFLCRTSFTSMEKIKLNQKKNYLSRNIESI